MTVPKKIKNRVKHNQKCCVKCNSTKQLTIDHIIPRSKNGTNHMANLQILCNKCNNIKSDNLPDIKIGKYVALHSLIYSLQPYREKYGNRFINDIIISLFSEIIIAECNTVFKYESLDLVKEYLKIYNININNIKVIELPVDNVEMYLHDININYELSISGLENYFASRLVI